MTRVSDLCGQSASGVVREGRVWVGVHGAANVKCDEFRSSGRGGGGYSVALPASHFSSTLSLSF